LVHGLQFANGDLASILEELPIAWAEEMMVEDRQIPMIVEIGQ
jgi:hypothetical protein